MNRIVSWNDLQYEREKILYNKVDVVLKELQSKYEAFCKKTQLQEKEFFNHLSDSVKIDKLPSVSDLLDTVNRNLHTDLRINVFLFQSPTSNAMCIPRYGLGSNDDELIILVSQHFLNYLTRQEQLCIIGHELGHLLFGHVNIPAKSILESEFELADAKDVKSNILKWMTCTEVSCDVIGFISCGGDFNVFCSAMLKFVTGILPVTEVSARIDNLINLVLQQYEDISQSLYDAETTTHPLTPLRLKIIESISDTQLIRQYGESIDKKALHKYSKKFNSVIDSIIQKIYPGIIPSTDNPIDDNLFSLGIAVALSDGEISKGEVLAIHHILNVKEDIDATYDKIKGRLARDSAQTIVEAIVNTNVQKIKKMKGIHKKDIVVMLRNLLLVAASDGKIEKTELDTIYTFSKEFGFSKQDLVLLVGQMEVQ